MKLCTARAAGLRAIVPEILTAVVSAAPAAMSAQGLSAEVSAGRLVYDPLAANIGTNNLMGSLRYDTAREAWVYGAAAAPLTDSATFWGGAGAGGRFARSVNPRASLGVDIAGHGYSYRDAISDQVWKPETWTPPDELPSAAEIYRDHRDTPGLTVEQTRAELEESIRERMW